MLLHLGNSFGHFLFKFYLFYPPFFIHLINLRALYTIFLSLKVTPEDVRKLNLPPEHINKTPSGEIFVKQSLQKVPLFVGLVILKFCWILSSGNTSVYKQKRIIYFRVSFQRFLKSLLLPVKELKQI